MATYNKFQQFIEDLNHGVHNLGSDSLKIALTSVAPIAGNSVLADLTEISYTNLTARDLTTTSSGQTAGVYKLAITDIALAASGGTVADFRYIVVYNDTPAAPLDPLICWFDYGGLITLLDGEQVALDFDDANGLFDNT